MSNRVFPANTSCSQHQSLSSAVVPKDAALVGHTFVVYGDYAIFDTTAGQFVTPERVQTLKGGKVYQGLVHGGF